MKDVKVDLRESGREEGKRKEKKMLIGTRKWEQVSKSNRVAWERRIYFLVVKFGTRE